MCAGLVTIVSICGENRGLNLKIYYQNQEQYLLQNKIKSSSGIYQLSLAQDTQSLNSWNYSTGTEFVPLYVW